MQCEVTPSRRSPQLALLIVVSLAVMAITGSFVKQQGELDQQADRLRATNLEIAAMKAMKAGSGHMWMGASVADPAEPSLTTIGKAGLTTFGGALRLGGAMITDDGSRFCISHAPTE